MDLMVCQGQLPGNDRQSRFLKIKAIAGIALWLSAVYCQADPVVLKMHVFAEQQQPESRPPTNALNMVIFDQATETTTGKSATNADPVVTTAAVVSDLPAQMQSTRQGRYWSAGLSSGYLQDSLQWQVAAADGSINPLLETRWDSRRLWQVKADLGFNLPANFVLQGHAAYAFAFAGDGQQNGYLDNHSVPAVQLRSSADSGYAAEFSGALGYQFDWAVADKLWLQWVPLAGYAFHEQKYSLQGGVEFINGVETAQADGNHHYLSGWAGPWVGFDLALALFDRHAVVASFGHHWADYKGIGNWQATGNTQRFVHRADAFAYTTSIGYRFMPSDRWALNLKFDYQNWSTDPGRETLSFDSGELLHSPLGSVKRESFGVSAGVNVAF